MTKRFFEKSIGQHVEENFRLNPESIMTGRERLLAVQSLLFFEGIPTVIGLSFSYVLLWILSPIIGLILTGFLAIYGLYVLYLNQKVLEACTPIDADRRERLANRAYRTGTELVYAFHPSHDRGTLDSTGHNIETGCDRTSRKGVDPRQEILVIKIDGVQYARIIVTNEQRA